LPAAFFLFVALSGCAGNEGSDSPEPGLVIQSNKATFGSPNVKIERRKTGPVEAILYSFPGFSGDGKEPIAPLALDGAGNLYGATERGGTSGNGTIFELTSIGMGNFTERVLYSFSGKEDGAVPVGVTLDQQGNLYGETQLGGDRVCQCGTVFELSPNGASYVYSNLHQFTGNPDGYFPYPPLAIDTSGSLYGTTELGGAGKLCPNQESGCGTVFKLTTSESGYSYRVIYSFEGQKNDGSQPAAGPLVLAGGELIGTTAGGNGTVYDLKPRGSSYSEALICTFESVTEPTDVLVANSDGDLFGTSGGGNGFGEAFRIGARVSGKYHREKTIYGFKGGPNDGQYPESSLVADAQGNLYGTTPTGGPYNKGVLFELSPPEHGKQYTESILYVFHGSTDGGSPYASLIFGLNGVLLGTTEEGGANGGGVAFEIVP
jgi:uncharacterized repeat protein (TIGR03803 family)